MDQESAHNKKWQILDVVFGIPLIVGGILHLVWPIPIIPNINHRVMLFCGIIVLIVGFILLLLSRQEFTRNKQNTNPGHPTTKLMTSGVYSISRNPMSLSCVCFLLSLVIILNELWFIVMLILAIILCTYILIIPEEKYLTTIFSDEYLKYTRKVNRWIGRKQ